MSKKVDAEFLDELAEGIKAKCGKDSNHLKTFIEKAISVSHRVGRSEEFLFCYVIARDENLWSELTKLTNDGGFFAGLGCVIPQTKTLPIVGRFIERAESRKEGSEEEQKKWFEVLKKSSPIFKYKIDNIKVTEAFGEEFDTFFCNSALSHYERWEKDIVMFHDYNTAVNYCMRDFVRIITGLAQPDRVVQFVQKGANFFATPHVLQALTPQQLFDLYRSQHPQLPDKVLDLIFGGFKTGFDGVSLFVSFVCKLTPEESEILFEKLDLISQPRHEFFIECLKGMASEKDCIKTYKGFWENLFLTNQERLVSVVFSSMSKNDVEFRALVESDYCHPNQVATNLLDSDVMGAFCRLELPLTEDYVRVILMSLVNSQLMLVLANGGLDFYMSTLRAYTNKAMTRLDFPDVREVVVPLFCKNSTRERFFTGMTRAQFIRLINSCEYEGNSRRVSQTFFQELQAENGYHRRFSSVLKCTDEITNTVFHEELSHYSSR